jgi:hypothetical protein
VCWHGSQEPGQATNCGSDHPNLLSGSGELQIQHRRSFCRQPEKSHQKKIINFEGASSQPAVKMHPSIPMQ